MGNNARRTARLYFVRSGYVYPYRGRLSYAGGLGGYWSGRASSSNYAYELYFNSSGVYPYNYYDRYYGYSVRCVAGWE